MAELSLRAYIDYIEDRLARDAAAEAVAQCRHILTVYPKHIDTYRVLAKATAAQDNYMDAIDLFQRVLSADPGDFVAHVGMSECYKEDGALDQAIWHLERAFEQVPSNRDLQNELKKLYEQRDGHAPLKVQMTSGALARMYVKGKLHEQAIAELTKALSQDPERLDLQVLLAEALWNNHQEVAAGKVAAEVLKKLPYSLDANRILGQLWLKAGQPAEARPFINRVKELNPYVSYRIEHDGEEAPADSFKLTTVDFGAEVHASQIGAADWVSEIQGIEKQKGVTGPFPEEGASITDIFGAPTPPATPAPPTPPSPVAEPGEMGTPDWLRSALGTGKLQATPSTQPEWLKDVLGGEGGVPAAPPASEPMPSGEGAPDWLKDVIQDAPPSTPSEIKSAPPSAEGAPDWLKDALGTGTPPAPMPPAQPAPAAGDQETPGWLADVLGEQTPASVQKPAAGEERARPAWLEDVLSSDTPAAPPPTGPKVISTDMLNKIIAGGAQPGDASPLTSAPLPEETSAPVNFDDLGEIESWDGAPAAGAEPVAPPPTDWLTQDTGLKREEKQTASEEETKLPDWLMADTPVMPKRDEQPAAEEESKSEMPSWLATETTDLSRSQPAESKAHEPASEELPDWLKGAASSARAESESQTEKVTEDELPDWLQGGVEDTKEKTGREAPADAEPAEPASTVPEEEKPVAPPDEGSTNGGQEDIPDWLASGDLDSDEAMKWLEEIAAKVDPNFKPEGSESAPAKEEAAPVAEAPKAEMKEEAADDLEWLRAPTEAKTEAQAAEEELPDWLKPAPEEAKAAAKATPAPTDPDTQEALAWLDDQVKGQGVSPEKPVAEALTPDHPPVAAMPKVPDLDAEAAPASDEELPDWLKDAGVQEERAKAMEAPDMAADLSDIPELPVEADELAWLNDALKAEEKAAAGDLEELFGEKGEAKEEEEELPDWLKGEEEEKKPAPVAEARIEEAPAPKAKEKKEEIEELPDWLKGEEEEKKPTPVAEAKIEEAPAPKAEEKKEEIEELPDWLKGGEPEPELEKKGTGGLTAFLKAVEPAAPPAEARAPEPPKAEPAPPPPPAPAPAAPAPIPPGEAGDKLKAAREQMGNGELQNALAIYEALVASGHGFDETISDLVEIVRTRAVVNPKVYRVLGDAMMRKGQMQEALDMYKKALDNF